MWTTQCIYSNTVSNWAPQVIQGNQIWITSWEAGRIIKQFDFCESSIGNDILNSKVLYGLLQGLEMFAKTSRRTERDWLFVFVSIFILNHRNEIHFIHFTFSENKNISCCVLRNVSYDACLYWRIKIFPVRFFWSYIFPLPLRWQSP